MPKYSPPRFLFRRFAILKRIRPADSFLEIGAGNLQLSSELVRLFAKGGTVIDFEDDVKKHHELLPEKVSTKIDLIIDDIFSVKLNKTYDCVVSCEVMEHIKNDKAFLKRIHSLTKKGGQVIISVPAKQKYWSVHDEAVGHYRRYEKEELTKLLESHGFKNVQIASYGFPFINLLMYLRILHGRFQLRQKKNWTAEKRTKESGVNQVPKSFDALGLVANKHVFAIPNIISSLFDRQNFSEGYVLTAEK